MADIKYGVTLAISKGYLNNSVDATGVTANMARAGLMSQTLTLSTNAVSIQTGQFSSVGLAFFQNLSGAATQTATVGIDNGGSFVGFATMRPGEPAVLRLTAGKDYQAIGGSGALLRVDITEG